MGPRRSPRRTSSSRPSRLRAWWWWAAAVCALLSVSCTNELEQFCEDASGKLCKQCFACASTPEAASAMCGIKVTTDEAGCREIQHRVCASDDVAFNAETGRACLERLDKLTCEHLAREGEPDVCRRLF